MKAWLRDNGLTLVLLLLFLISLVGLIFSGFAHENDERTTHGLAAISLAHYLLGPAFSSAVFENWESEFLQMFSYVVLTAYLFQRGSPESKDPDKPSVQDGALKPGLGRLIYAHSLGLALLGLFVLSFVLHWLNSARVAQEEALMHQETPPTVLAHLASSSFWFESFQNWQSEFLSTAVLIVLAIFLREHRSPESKPVRAPNWQTGTD